MRFSCPYRLDASPGSAKSLERKWRNADLRKLDSSALEHEFGRYGRRLYELARGIDDSEVVPDRSPTQL